MTFHEFNLLPYAHRLATVYEAGTYLATRREDVNAGVLLSHLPSGVFAASCYDVDQLWSIEQHPV